LGEGPHELRVYVRGGGQDRMPPQRPAGSNGARARQGSYNRER
jgi:hypothetical protein